jgi:hypothetical protein
MQQRNSADIRLKISNIYKYISTTHNELRYQVKIHAIFEKLTKEKKKKIYCIFFPQFFFLMKKKQKNNKNMLLGKR